LIVDGSSVDVEGQYQRLSGCIIAVQSAITHCSPILNFQITTDLKSHSMNLDILSRQVRLLRIKKIN